MSSFGMTQVFEEKKLKWKRGKMKNKEKKENMKEKKQQKGIE